MLQERGKTTGPDDSRRSNDRSSRHGQDEISSGSIITAISPTMESNNGDSNNISATQSAHQKHGQSANDICTAPSEAEQTTSNGKTPRSSIGSNTEISKPTSRAQSFTDAISRDTEKTTTTTINANQPATTTIEDPSWQNNNADETKGDFLPRADDINAITFIKDKKGRYHPVSNQRLRNNLLPSVGFLEFANATDFAANVWNTIPVPTFAAVLMGLGGVLALMLVPFAIKDGLLCYQNSKTLIQERILLLREAGETVDEEKGKVRIALQKGLDTRLEVNRRELGTEVVDRLSMDVLMGISALLVGVGTLMAIGGANPRVYKASNLLSGYIGNSPSGLWGVLNTLWCIYLFMRARRHLAVGNREVEVDGVKQMLRRRIRLVQRHSVIMGSSTLVSAAGGMVTATRWYGYVMLIPCVVASLYGNWFWRQRLGYDRPLARIGHERMSKETLIKELEWVVSMRTLLATSRKSTSSMDMTTEPKSTSALIDLILRCDLFETLCKRLLENVAFALMMEQLQDSSDGIVVISSRDICLAACDEMSTLILKACKSVMQKKGPRQLRQKQRYLLEMLGSSLCEDLEKPPSEGQRRRRRSIMVVEERILEFAPRPDSPSISRLPTRSSAR